MDTIESAPASNAHALPELGGRKIHAGFEGLRTERHNQRHHGDPEFGGVGRIEV